MCEMVATRHRGTLVAILNVGPGGVGNFLSCGLFLLLLGLLAPVLGGDHLVWRWTFALIVVVYRRRLPETPRFLLSQGRVDDANRSLARRTD
ncbi:sugar porter family MFS transporter [Streptomyces sp. NBC_00988]|nr:sugar porter family MFS transporter [Streptomyces sp. NBC_00988]